MHAVPRFIRGTGASLFLVFVFIACSAQKTENFEFQQAGATMGTTFSVKVPRLPKGLDSGKLRDQIEKTLDHVNSVMSTYLPDSELSRLNRNPSTEWISISAELAEVIDESLRISELSDGAYDVTVGPLVNLWGFGPEKAGQGVPTPEEIDSRLKKCSFKKIHLNPEKNALRKEDPEIYIDLSSLAKGYGVDKVANLLEASGIDDYLVEIGGELRVSGGKADGNAWRVAIEKPLAGERSVAEVIELKDIAVATSGDYRNFFEDEDVRYSHTIDPRTGMPVDHALASVTVLDESTMRADALATALMVLGPESGFDLVQTQNIAAFFIKRDGGGFVTLKSPAFSRSPE